MKIFSNRNVSDIINMTRDYSLVAVDISIEYGENLEYVENVLEKELPAIAKKLPAICDGPFYKGVSQLGSSSVDLRIICRCNESDRIQLDRDLRRQLKLVFDRHNINIPFPQVVVNQPETSFHHTTRQQKEQAESFHEAQQEATKDIVI